MSAIRISAAKVLIACNLQHNFGDINWVHCLRVKVCLEEWDIKEEGAKKELDLVKYLHISVSTVKNIKFLVLLV